jgi:hypothetical protein
VVIKKTGPDAANATAFIVMHVGRAVMVKKGKIGGFVHIVGLHGICI